MTRYIAKNDKNQYLNVNYFTVHGGRESTVGHLTFNFVWDNYPLLFEEREDIERDFQYYPELLKNTKYQIFPIDLP